MSSLCLTVVTSALLQSVHEPLISLIVLVHASQDAYSFLHISRWYSKDVQLNSVTLLPANCLDGEPRRLLQASAEGGPSTGGCAVAISASNSTLGPVLEEHGAADSSGPLIIFLQGNATLASDRFIPVNRPVYFIGLATQLLAIDLGMRINQLDLTGSEEGSVNFMSVMLENAAPGNSRSRASARPYSSLMVQHIWAVYFVRWV